MAIIHPAIFLALVIVAALVFLPAAADASAINFSRSELR